MKCIKWKGNHIEIIDQTKLPGLLEWIECNDVKTLGEAIKRLSVRGAPALGIAAGMGMALASILSEAKCLDDLKKELSSVRDYIAGTRPTAVNLFWALDRMMEIVNEHEGDIESLRNKLEAEALKIDRENKEMCMSVGDHGAELVKEGWNILTHCNAGFLATGDYGTAIGVIRSAHKQKKNIHVYVDETRPLLQGSRLTAWELKQDKIPYTLIADNMAGYLMKQGKIDMVVVGADRITAEGDVANKIGTYSLAVLANYHGIPFYPAAPFSTIDMSIKSGNDIVIEERNHKELVYFQGIQSAPLDSDVYNPAFDVTPHNLVTAIITEKGVLYPPFDKALEEMMGENQGL
ncbi:MAG: S-methyl-5-thioribose-1-phosphate isomerase [Candidatus Eremiobacteraeota bacterium]|nr:S-methyl-5-thioribose-1-phosphate isomerase [Candidatus Eremiobacteraeota bacterium]